ncbi:hypothetical protein AB0O91_19000 [Kitasatospora sp. NPDC089797]|uniref:hypothetical protein n=1 Tax=Kitasatospora sp. NPDC089797 TaxID=3155298 RepID=UPI00343830BA
MPETFLDLGSVTAPSGVLVLGLAGWIDYWPELGRPLAERARAAAAAGGAHLRDGECEAVAVPAAADRPLQVRATVSPSPFDEEPTVATLEIELGLPWPGGPDRSTPVPLGDLPVDRCGMVIGDATGLAAWTGPDDESTDGLADVTYWGRYEEDAHARFGGERIAQYGAAGPYGWLDLPVAEATARASDLTDWQRRHHGKGLAVSVDRHTDHYRFQRAGWHHPLLVGAIEVGGCRVLGLDWDQGDHAVRHHGGRDWGRTYPVVLAATGDGGTVLRWTIPPYDEDEDE